MLKRLPDDIKTILEGLRNNYVVEKYTPQYLGWSLDIIIDSHRFNLIKEWHQVFISGIVDEEKKHIWPKEDQKENLDLEHAIEVLNGYGT